MMRKTDHQKRHPAPDSGVNTLASLLAEGDYAAAERWVLAWLDAPHPNGDWPPRLLNRLAEMINVFLGDRAIQHSEPFLLGLVVYKTQLSNLFYVTGREHLDTILKRRGLFTVHSPQRLPQRELLYWLACYCLNSELKPDWESLLKHPSGHGLTAYLASLNGLDFCFSEAMEQALNRLLAARDHLSAVHLSDLQAELTVSPWMLCSYYDRADRHAIKPILNVLIERWLSQRLADAQWQAPREQPPARQKPRLLVACEQYRSNHAVYRCFHRYICSLAEDYEVIGVAEPNSVDAISSQDFSRMVWVENRADAIVETLTTLHELKPDLLFYPSLGMAKWTVFAANQRIAPKQLVGIGHPASSFSRHIDYLVAGALPEGPDYQRFCSENVLPLFEQQNFYAPHPEACQPPSARPEDGVVRIAINSSLPKLNRRFLNLCKTLNRFASVPLEFHFFLTANRNFAIEAFASTVADQVGDNCVVHRPCEYGEYLERLAKMDLAISTFPFGGSNSNADLALCGVPKVVYLEPEDLAAYTDTASLAPFKLSPLLHPKTEAALIANLIFLIHNPAERARLRQKLQHSQPAERLYANQERIADNALLRTLRAVS